MSASACSGFCQIAVASCFLCLALVALLLVSAPFLLCLLCLPCLLWHRADQANGFVHMSSARLAQPVERKALNLVVVGSSPTVGVFWAWSLYSYGAGQQVPGSNPGVPSSLLVGSAQLIPRSEL